MPWRWGCTGRGTGGPCLGVRPSGLVAGAGGDPADGMIERVPGLSDESLHDLGGGSDVVDQLDGLSTERQEVLTAPGTYGSEE